MNRNQLNEHLSKISTIWTVLRQAHEGSPSEAATAQRLLLERYGGAAHRYLLHAVGDPHAADDLLQEFGLALIRGDFRGADPERRRFRFYIKTVLRNLVHKHRQRQPRQPRPVPPRSPELVDVAAPAEESDGEFNESWRQELLARTWDALAQVQPSFHTVLRFRAEHPEMRSEEMAAQLSGRLNKPLTAEGVRQTLRRARDKFADLLLDEIAASLEAPTLEQVEEELAELNLLEYCRPALERRGTG